jgi:cytochrome P450
MFTDLAIKYDLQGIYYLDLYPVGESMVFITDPHVASQVQSDTNTFYRHPFALSTTARLSGKKSLFSTMGATWQRQRGWFAPAFSMSHLLTLVPAMVEETLVFKENLTRFAVSGEVFPMNDAAVRLAIDFIGRTVGDIRLGSQTGYSAIQSAFESTINWTPAQAKSLWKKVCAPIMEWWYASKLDRLLGAEIRERFKGKAMEERLSKSILDLAWKGYLKEKAKAGGTKVIGADQDEEFMQIALDK